MKHEEIKIALEIAALALAIAHDWGVESVQVDPPSKWGLDGGGEDAANEWCSTISLSEKLTAISKEL